MPGPSTKEIGKKGDADQINKFKSDFVEFLFSSGKIGIQNKYHNKGKDNQGKDNLYRFPVDF